MKIPFSIEYRPQIESGEYKVILDCGVEAEILAWDKPGEYPIVCMAKKEGAIPFRTDNNGIAYHYPEGSNYSDLFVIAPEPEMTAFEKKVFAYCDGKTVGEELIKRIAKDLLALAKKEVVKGLPKWKKVKANTVIGNTTNPHILYRDDRGRIMSAFCYVPVNGHYILLDELEGLPMEE